LPRQQEVVIRVWEATATVEATRTAVVHVAAASAEEAAVVQERAMDLVREKEARAALVETEAREEVLRMEAESATTLASTHGEAEGFTRRISLLEGELMNALQARDMTEVNSRGLSSVVAGVDWWQEEVERECQERVRELTLLQTWGSELCQAIVGPLKMRGQLSEGMWIAVVSHTEMDEQLTMLWAMVSSVVQSVLRCSPIEA
jgi:hypothetical protein